MNKHQIVAMWIGLSIVVLMGLFPPFHRFEFDPIKKFAGYHLFFASEIEEKYIVDNRLTKAHRKEEIESRIEKLSPSYLINVPITRSHKEDFPDEDIEDIAIYFCKFYLEKGGAGTWEDLAENPHYLSMFEKRGINSLSDLADDSELISRIKELIKLEIEAEVEMLTKELESIDKIPDDEVRTRPIQVMIDYRMLFLQWFLVIVAMIGFILTFKTIKTTNRKM